MIILKEDNTSNMTVKEFCTAVEDIYYDYFPKSLIKTGVKDYYNPRYDSTDYIIAGLSLNPDYMGRGGDPFYGVYFALFPSTNMELKEDTYLPSKVYIGSGRENLESIQLRDENRDIHFVHIPAKIMFGRDASYYTPEDIVEWFDGYCSRLFKALRKALRNGMLNSRWDEFL